MSNDVTTLYLNFHYADTSQSRHNTPHRVPFLPVTCQTHLHRRLDDLLLLDLLAKDGVKEERGGTVVDQPGRLLQGLQIRPLLTHGYCTTEGYDGETAEATLYSGIKSTGLRIVAHRRQTQQRDIKDSAH